MLDQISEVIDTKMNEVLKNKYNKNGSDFKQIGNKFKKIREYENTIKTNQSEYKNQLLAMLEFGIKNYRDGVFDKRRQDLFRSLCGTDYDKLINSIKESKPEEIINNLKKEKFYLYPSENTSTNVYKDLLTDQQKTKLDDLEKRIDNAKAEKVRLYEEIGSEEFRSQLKELDEIREYMTFFCKHNKSDLGKLKQILNNICQFLGLNKLFKEKKHLEFKRNPFDLIKPETSLEEKPKMSESNQNRNMTLT